MKTTLEIADATFRRAKSLAAMKGITLRQLFTEALEEKLRDANQGKTAGEPPWLKLAGAFGKNKADREETRKIQELIEQEFGVIEPEDER